MRELMRRLWYLLNRPRFDKELARELEAHAEMAEQAGTRTRLGDPVRLREDAREAWGWTWIDRLGQDVRYAVRMLRRSPAFTATAMLMLAIGIGVNVAAFGFFNLMFLRVLPVRDPDSILRLERRSPEGYSSELTYPAMAFYRDRVRTLRAVLAARYEKLALDGQAEPLRAQFVTANFFDELGAGMTLGRGLDPVVDARLEGAPRIVLGEDFWQRRFGGDPLIIGRVLRLNGNPATVVGVASPQFSGLHGDQPDLWVPIAAQPYFFAGSQLLTDLSGNHGGVNVWGRLTPGATPQAAEEELRLLAMALRQQHPDGAWEHERLVSEPGAYGVGTRAGTSKGSGARPNPRAELYVVSALVGALALLMLAATCGNLGSLLLARGVARERELTIRSAVGAGSGRLIRQLFTESLVLALAGAVAGLGLGYAVLRGLMTLSGAPAWVDATPDWRVAAFAAAAAFLSAVLFGLTPAFQVVRRRTRASLIRQVLIGAQVAASFVLLVVAGLLTRAVDHLMFTPPGFDYEHVVSISPGLGGHSYTPARAQAYLDALQARVRQLPGVEAVARVSIAPMGNAKIVTEIIANGRHLAMYFNRVDSDYFHAMRIPLLRGRTPMPGESHVVVLSASAAALAWPEEDPLGKTISDGEDSVGSASGYTVVGISGNARVVALEDPDAVEVYFPVATPDLPSANLVVRSSRPPQDLVASVVSIARGLDGDVFPEVQVLRSAYERKLQSAERGALAVSALGIGALLLACLGITGLVAYAVSQRTKEIGILMALGAARSQVLAAVLRQFSRPVVGGLIVGLGGAAALSQGLRRQLYGLSSLDPLAYLATIVIFLAAVTVASLLPARRALRVDPILALRCE